MIFLTRWNHRHTDLSKYLLSKFIQLVDMDESINNRFSATNGLILLDQIKEICSSILRRPKNANRLNQVFKEAADKQITSSIVNDLIIEQYFSSIKQWVESWKNSGVKLENVKEVLQQTEIYISIVRSQYVNLIKEELLKINLTSTDGFDLKVSKLNKLINSLVAQLIYEGYSVAFLQIACKRLAWEKPDNLVRRLFEYFFKGEEPNKERVYTCFLPGDLNDELITALNADFKVTGKKEFYLEPMTLEGYQFRAVGRDPYSAYRNQLITAFRKLSLLDPKFQQESYNHVWESPYYRNSGTEKYIRYNFYKNIEPAILKYRNNTLISSLRSVGKSLNDYAEQ